jgi:hypothetical protein
MNYFIALFAFKAATQFSCHASTSPLPDAVMEQSRTSFIRYSAGHRSSQTQYGQLIPAQLL